jgi:hypothetical protein
MATTKLAENPPRRPIALEGLSSVEWICPACGSPYWGTSGAWRICRGTQYGFGHCRFKSPVDLDWMYFRRRADASVFTSPAEYEKQIGPASEDRGVA